VTPDISNNTLRERFLENLKELPTLPTVVAQLMLTLNEPTSSARDLERLIANDQAIAAKVLKLANSAFYGLPGKVSSLGRAITLLGFNTVRSLVLTIGIVEKFSGPSGGRYFDRGEFWEHSLSVAMTCKLLSTRDPAISSEESHLAGLLHDIGKVIMDFSMPAKFQTAMEQVTLKELDPLEAERKYVGLSHDEVGEIAAEKWQFPEFIREVIRYHHTPLEVPDNDTVQLVAMANIIVHAFKQQEKDNLDYQLPELEPSWRERWVPTPRHDELIVTKYEVEIEKVRDILSLYN
jgi:putative nucleotidyltransferase with HDIG domain